MNAEAYQPTKGLIFIVICFFLLITFQSKIAAGQSVAKAQKDFDKLNGAYLTDKISAKKYLDSAGRLTDQYLSNGIHFKIQEMTDLLSLYKEIAWSKKGYGHFREQYYIIFLNDACMFEQTGASMYYAEKVNQECKKNGDKHSLIEVLQKNQVYMEEELSDKVIALYKNEKSYLKALPDLLQKNQVNNATGMDAVNILSGVIESYIKIKDTIAVYQVTLLANQIGNALKHKYPINRQYMFYNDFFMLVRQHDIALFEGNQIKESQLLDSITALKTTYKDQATVFIDINLFPWQIDHYFAIKRADSVGKYIKKYETSPFFNKNQQARIDEYKAKLLAMQGDLYGSNKWLNSALIEERKIKSSLMTEMDSLLYAYTEAENAKIDLQESEKAKQQQTIWLMAVSLLAAIIVLVIYLIMLSQSRKAKEQVEALNNVANMQIIAMEEVKHQAAREEQQRLGQDLHDGLSSSIASFRNQLETLSIDATDIVLKNKFDALRAEMAKAYAVVRNKSHEWFSVADKHQEQSFEDHIRLLADSALPDSRYNKNIHIDDNSLKTISLDTRIALLRIIQEAITNIIKHAKAKNVGILIYAEMDSLLLTISDDGKGFREIQSIDEKSSMGLQSIRRRVQYLNGETNIHSDTKGTEITVSIPLM